jgi:hypothetical protein
MSSEYFHHEVPIAHFPDDERGVEDCLPEPRGKIVEHHHLLPART